MRYTGVQPAVLVLALAAFLLPAVMAPAGGAEGKRPPKRHGYGFLPGYEPPDLVQRRNGFEPSPGYWWGDPQFYRGRWNGGGFGPCWTQTPIGPHWNCG